MKNSISSWISSTKNKGYSQYKKIKKYISFCYSKYNIKHITWPLRWFYKLDSIEKFTAILCVIGVLQVYTFIESERAYLVIPEDIRILNNAPVIDYSTKFTLTIKNIGKHIASIRAFKVKALLAIHEKTLPDLPTYGNSMIQVVSPTLPEREVSIQLNPFFQNIPISNEEMANGIKNGTIPLYIYGSIEYNIGYLGFTGTTGYCFKYIPEQIRPDPNVIFQICENQNYTYAH